MNEKFCTSNALDDGRRPPCRSAPPPLSPFVAACLLCLALAGIGTSLWEGAMTSMGGTPMPRGWSMPGMWTLLCGKPWLSSAISFIGMWTTMMIPMMLPSLSPVLWHHNKAFIKLCAHHGGYRTAMVGVGYFCAWAVAGAVVYLVGTLLLWVAVFFPMLARHIPIISGIVIVIAGLFQLTKWKMQLLYACTVASCQGKATLLTAWRIGFNLGSACVLSCLGLTILWIFNGMMDPVWMMIMTFAVMGERIFLPGAEGVRMIGIGLVVAGAVICAQAVSR